ncbi:hypothetical protein ACFXPZ_44615 [Streptomyces sp. NPDC059101]|uniref:hypothetical protein n=1 Tax=Streptomyces sp. NPDC059101 TaxID=3346728 RepID=UPI0036C445DD
MGRRAGLAATAAPEELAADKNLATGRALDPRRSTRITAGTAELLHGPITPGPCCLRVGGGRWRGVN